MWFSSTLGSGPLGYPKACPGRSAVSAIRQRLVRRLTVEALEDRTLLSFLAPVNYATGANPRSALVGDFNGDGVLDVAVVNGNSNTVNVFLGNGNGAFQAGRSTPIGTNPSFGGNSAEVSDHRQR